MQEREKVSNIDIKAHLNNLRKNPKFTEEMLKLVEADLRFGLTIPETELYTQKRFDYAQMKVYSECLRNGYPEDVRDCIAKDGLSGEQMAVALEFYKKGVPAETVREITENNGQTAFAMKKLFQNIMQKLEEAGGEAQKDGGYAEELMEQIKSVVQRIEYQGRCFDILNGKLKEIQVASQDAEVQKKLLTELSEKDRLLEKQQNELNEARAAVARLRNEIDREKKEKDRLGKHMEELERGAATREPERDKADKSIKGVPENVPEAVPTEAGQALQAHAALREGVHNIAVVERNGTVVSVLPVERMEYKKERPALTSIFSRFAFKRKIDIVRLVAGKNFGQGQLVQIRSAIEKGLSDRQLTVLINSNLTAGQMEEIIKIAVFENGQDRRGI